MKLPTTAFLPTAKTPTIPLVLDHDVVALSKVQRRLSGRIALAPKIDLDSYRFRTLVDWIEFRIHLGRPSQTQHVQAVLRKFLARDSHIMPEDKGPGDVFAICTIKIQEPASLALVTKIHQSLVNTFGEATGSRVTGIEVSIDAFPRQPSDAARALLLGAMQRTIWTGRDIWSNPDSRPRMVFGRGKKSNYKLSPEPEKKELVKPQHNEPELLTRAVPFHHNIPAIDGTMYLGARADAIMIRIMDKVIDGQRPNGTFIVLHDDRKRVRAEVTLTGTELLALSLTDIGSLKAFRLSTLQKRYFQFRLPTFSQRLQTRTGADVAHNIKQTWRAQTYLRSGVTGLIAMDAETDRHMASLRRGALQMLRAMNLPTDKLKTKNRLAAPFYSWDSMNRKLHDAFADLEKREVTAWKQL